MRVSTIQREANRLPYRLLPMMWVLLAIGGSLCVLNMYLSLLRYPLHRLRGGLPEDYRWVSSIPLVGSLLVVLSWSLWLRHEGSTALDLLAWSLIAIDTGGVHWFVWSLVNQRIRGSG